MATASSYGGKITIPHRLVVRLVRLVRLRPAFAGLPGYTMLRRTSTAQVRERGKNRQDAEGAEKRKKGTHPEKKIPVRGRGEGEQRRGGAEGIMWREYSSG